MGRITFKRWGQVKGSKVNEGISWRGILGTWPPASVDAMGQIGLPNTHSCHSVLRHQRPKGDGTNRPSSKTSEIMKQRKSFFCIS